MENDVPQEKISSTPVVTETESTHSPTIGKIAEALAKAQADMVDPIADKDNPFFKSKYVDLAGVNKAIRKPLSSNGIAYVHTCDGTGSSHVQVNTRLVHSSGEWLSSTVKLKPTKLDPQAVGGALTYGRRYNLTGLCGLAADADDDGNAASGGHKNYEIKNKPKATPRRK